MELIQGFLAMVASFMLGVHTEQAFWNPDQCAPYPLYYGSTPFQEQGWIDPEDGPPQYCVDDGPSFWVYRIMLPNGSLYKQQIGVVGK